MGFPPTHYNSFELMHKYLIGLLLFGIGGLSLIVFLPSRPAQAQAGSAAALIDAVNAYRAVYGLAPYQVDGALMSEAQSQSEYQAKIGACTHKRADGSGPGDHGISAENVACGTNLSVEGAIYRQWVDPVHNATILGPDTGLVGAGVAVSGNQVYYTLDVKRLSGAFIYRPPKATDTSAPGKPTATPNPLLASAGPLVTATALEDGSVKHTVLYGQTLIAIAKAYGITLESIYALNKNLDPKNPVYYAGQILVIRAAFTATPSPSATPSPLPPTRTPTTTRAPTLAPSRTLPPNPSPTITPLPWYGAIQERLELGFNRRTLAYALILLGLVGVIFVVVRGFRKEKKH